MGKLKPLEDFVDDVNPGDLVRLPISHEEGPIIGYFVGHFCQMQRYGKSTWALFCPGFSAKDLEAFGADTSFDMDDRCFSGGDFYSQEYEILRRFQKVD